MQFCCHNQDSKLQSSFENHLNEFEVNGIFNPSFFVKDDLEVFSFRAIADKETSEPLSYISVKSRQGVHRANISKYLENELLDPRFIDPKIFTIDNDIYITFNSGWCPGGNNIFVMKVFPNIERPKRVLYDNRQPQERNWAFFSRDGEIYALYWINPLVILKLTEQTDATWKFVEWHNGDAQPDVDKDLTIGTQINNSYFVGHGKLKRDKKKIYLGRLMSLDFDQKKINQGKYSLSHSFESLLKCKPKHNENLFSCTYFSGLQVNSIKVTLSYGINDTEYGFSTHEINDL